MKKGLEEKACEEQLRSLGLFRLEESPSAPPPRAAQASLADSGV